MFERLSREALSELAARVAGSDGVRAAGVARRLEDDRLVVLYLNAHGLGEYELRQETCYVLQAPARAGYLEAPVESGDGDPFSWYLTFDGVARVASMPVADVETEGRVWFGLDSEAGPSSAEGLRDLAGSWASLSARRFTADQHIAHLERLDDVMASLPVLLQVLDVREIFARLSDIAQAALPHDMLTLGLFDEDMSRVTMYARTGHGDDLGRQHPQPYPPRVVQAWRYDVIHDRLAHPLERDRPPTRLGMRSSVRQAILAEGRVIGGLAFNAKAERRYSMLDV